MSITGWSLTTMIRVDTLLEYLNATNTKNFLIITKGGIDTIVVSIVQHSMTHSSESCSWCRCTTEKCVLYTRGALISHLADILITNIKYYYEANKQSQSDM